MRLSTDEGVEDRSVRRPESEGLVGPRGVTPRGVGTGVGTVSGVGTKSRPEGPIGGGESKGGHRFVVVIFSSPN